MSIEIHYQQLRERLAERTPLDQQRIADIAGVHHNTVKRIVKGSVTPSVLIAAWVEQALARLERDEAAGR